MSLRPRLCLSPSRMRLGDLRPRERRTQGSNLLFELTDTRLGLSQTLRVHLERASSRLLRRQCGRCCARTHLLLRQGCSQVLRVRLQSARAPLFGRHGKLSCPLGLLLRLLELCLLARELAPRLVERRLELLLQPAHLELVCALLLARAQLELLQLLTRRLELLTRRLELLTRRLELLTERLLESQRHLLLLTRVLLGAARARTRQRERRLEHLLLI